MFAKEIEVGKCYVGEMTMGLPFVVQITRVFERGECRGTRDVVCYGNTVFFLFTSLHKGNDTMVKPEWLHKQIDEGKYSEIRGAEQEEAKRLINELHDAAMSDMDVRHYTCD